MNLKVTALLVSFIAISQYSSSQSDSSKFLSRREESVTISDRDFKDSLSGKRQGKKNDSLAAKQKAKKYFLTILPAVGYTLQTGFAGLISANIGYYNDKEEDAKMSTISSSFTYSQYNQIILPLLDI